MLTAVALIRAVPGADPERITALVRLHHGYIWRLLRRLGLSEGDADDGVQQTFLIAAEKLEHVLEGRERAFLYGVALNVAARIRRRTARHREEPLAPEHVESLAAEPPADALLEQRRARELLDELLAAMAEELRVVFVLYEIEELGTAEIASLLGVPLGTVASRLRRAREDFAARVARCEARRRFSEGSP